MFNYKNNFSDWIINRYFNQEQTRSVSKLSIYGSAAFGLICLVLFVAAIHFPDSRLIVVTIFVLVLSAVVHLACSLSISLRNKLSELYQLKEGLLETLIAYAGKDFKKRLSSDTKEGHIFEDVFLGLQMVGEELDAKFNEISTINANLEKLVGEKVESIKKIFANIDLGIFTIGEDLLVQNEFSNHINFMFYDENLIAGRNVLDLVFSSSNLGSDKIGQIEEVLRGSIGQDRINFDLNSHLLPSEVEIKKRNDQILDLNWNAICDNDGVVHSIMAIARDVTESRKIIKQTLKFQDELTMIGQILEVGLSGFSSFLKYVKDDLKECGRIIGQETITVEDVKVLFHKLHTIKGSSRVYRLSFAVDAVHRAERYYQQI